MNHSLFCFLSIAVSTLATGSVHADDAIVTRTEQATAFSQSRDDFPCWQASEDARNQAKQACAEAGYDGFSQQIGNAAKVESLPIPLAEMPTEKEVKWLEQGYRSLCTMRVTVECRMYSYSPPPPPTTASVCKVEQGMRIVRDGLFGSKGIPIYNVIKTDTTCSTSSSDGETSEPYCDSIRTNVNQNGNAYSSYDGAAKRLSYAVTQHWCSAK